MVLKKPRQLLIVFGTFAGLSIAALFVLDSHREFGRELTALEAQLHTETRLLAEHARLSIAAADVVLMEVEASVARIGLGGLGNDQAYWEAFRGMLDRTPQLKSLVIADAEGMLAFSTAVFPLLEVFDISDREYFNAHLRGEKHFVGKPIIGRISSHPIIPVSIRLDGPGGEFKGVIISALDMTYFQDPFTGASDQIELQIGIYRDDGVALSTMPALEGRQAAGSQLGLSASVASPEEDVISLEDSHVGKRIVVQRRVDGYPILVSQLRLQCLSSWSVSSMDTQRAGISGLCHGCRSFDFLHKQINA